MKRLYTFFAALLSCASIFSQEALKSTEEEYYDFLSLQGLVERPTLGYRTLSDNEWILTEDAKTADENVWKNNSLGSKWTVYEPAQKIDNFFTRGIDQSIKVKAYGPEWYNSYNTAIPYGQNDGALWQGKGYNTSFTAGARLEAYGLEVTFKPQLSFSQNREFDYIIDNRMQSSAYSDKADTYGYLWGVIDAPQRFGDESFYTYDWGDTEIRYTWHNLTTGIGTQPIWLGSSFLNSVLGSNNAGSYPKFDIGLRKTKIYIPFYNWYVGDIEARIWMGYLTESDYFDDNDSNNHNRINGFTFSYAPSLLPGLSLGITKICLSQWDKINIRYLNPLYATNSGVGTAVGEDQKASVYADWICPEVGLELYGELGVDDYYYKGWKRGLVRYAPENIIWTMGLKKTVNFTKVGNVHGEIILEVSDWEMPRSRLSDNQTYSFNTHYQIQQGFTNNGQAIGSPLGIGGNSQYLGFKIYYPKGSSLLFINRTNPDTTYSYINNTDNHGIKGMLTVGLETDYFVNRNFNLFGGASYSYIENPYYFERDDSGEKIINPDTNNIIQTGKMNNFSFSLGAKYNF